MTGILQWLGLTGLLAVGCGTVSAAAADDAKVERAVVQFRLAEKEPAAGLDAHTLPGSQEKIYLQPASILDPGEIAAAKVVADGRSERYTVAVTFTPAGAKKMAAATSQHLHKRLAIVVDGKLVAAPTIRSQISLRASITGAFSREEADRIAASLR